MEADFCLNVAASFESELIILLIEFFYLEFVFFKATCDLSLLHGVVCELSHSCFISIVV
jgi:hypothetical protein